MKIQFAVASMIGAVIASACGPDHAVAPQPAERRLSPSAQTTEELLLAVREPIDLGDLSAGMLRDRNVSVVAAEDDDRIAGALTILRGFQAEPIALRIQNAHGFLIVE